MLTHLKCYLVLLFSLAGMLRLEAQVLPGASQTGRYFPMLAGKQIGIVANRASVVPVEHPGSDSSRIMYVNTVDLLCDSSLMVVRIFSPEHGFRSSAEAGATVSDNFDSLTGIPVVSLYGKRKKPDSTSLAGIEIMVFDLQDVGVRFYTYISTLTFVMEACAERNIHLIVLDRPNPNGDYIDGPVLDAGFRSFVGMHEIPVVYAMTIGEYAQMINGEGWLKGGIKCKLSIVPVKDYNHRTKVIIHEPPSPNLMNGNAIRLYPSLCFFEGTVMSVGRGTKFPFEVFGHPDYPDTVFCFTPVGQPGKSANPPYGNRRCFGIDLRGIPLAKRDSAGQLNLEWLIGTYKKMGSKPGFFNDYFDKLAGNETLKADIINDTPIRTIRDGWQEGLNKFRKIREKYLIYND